MGYKKQYNKKKILKVLKDNRGGLTTKEIDAILNIEYLATYLGRLVNEGLVEWFNQKGDRYKSYRLTDKYFEPERQKEALKTLEIIKGLIKKGFMTYDKSKMTPNEIKRLEGII